MLSKVDRLASIPFSIPEVQRDAPAIPRFRVEFLKPEIRLVYHHREESNVPNALGVRVVGGSGC